MGRVRRGALGLVICGVLLCSGYLLSAAMQPNFLSAGSKPVTVVGGGEVGFLVVDTMFVQALGGGTPIPGVKVGVAQQELHGVRLTLQTNDSGMVEFVLGAGGYGVVVTDPRFSLGAQVIVDNGTTTFMVVSVNRSSTYATFADLSDSSGSGYVNVWDTMELAFSSNGTGNVPVIYGPVAYSAQNISAAGLGLKLGATVFVEPTFNYGLAGFYGPSGTGPEVPAKVLATSQASGTVWAELQPIEPLPVQGVTGVALISYAPSLKVTQLVG